MQFEFATAARVVFGSGTAEAIGREAAALGRRAFVLTGAGPERALPLLRRLENHHVAHARFPVGREPTTDLVAVAAREAARFGCDLVIGIGGGSVLDAAKAVAALLANGGDLMQYLEVIGEGLPLQRPSVPCIAIPTTAGTGSEVTRNAVLEAPGHPIKVSLRSAFMLPRLALVDPELTCSMPPALTAATGLDALTQLLEAFVSRSANPLTDAVCREGLWRVGRSLERAFANGEDRQAREDMALASLCGGSAAPTMPRTARCAGGCCRSSRPLTSRPCVSAIPVRRPSNASRKRRAFSRVLRAPAPKTGPLGWASSAAGLGLHRFRPTVFHRRTARS